MTDAPISRPRYAVLDLARGGAIVAMVFYHFVWDLHYYGFFGTDVASQPAWVAYARTILSAFLLLAGIGLVLAHREGIRWRAFWRREIFLVAAALIITVGTWFAFGESFVFFGVLHAIALFSLMALPFLRAPMWLTGLVAIVVLVPPRLVRFDAFNGPELAWIGFWTDAPPTADLVPVLPWFGVTLIGVMLGRALLDSDGRERLAAINPVGRISRMMAFMGRWSLLIYVLHQPFLHAVMYPVAILLHPQVQSEQVEFAGACQFSCEQGSGEAGFCQRYCACFGEQIEMGNVGDLTRIAPENLTESQAVADVAALCSAMARTD